MAQRKQFAAALKAKVAIEAVKSEKTINQIASIYQVHPNQVYKWKKQALDLLPKAMSDRRNNDHTNGHADVAKLYQQIGQLGRIDRYQKLLAFTPIPSIAFDNDL